ncbi:MAG: anti-sigma regulatory factor [Nitrospiraceae bacterium]
MVKESVLPINSDSDVVAARQRGREVASLLGFTQTDLTIIATAISELARNIVTYAKHGEIVIKNSHVGDKVGIVVVARDKGPGIADISQAMQDGFSTSGGLGLGLPGVKRLVDEFHLVSDANSGTTVTIKKWKR